MEKWITSVQEQESGWLVNGAMNVPNDPRNRDCRAVLEWINEGNTPDPKPKPSKENEDAAQVEALIHEKQREIAVEALKAEGTLDQNGKLIK